MLFCCAGCFVVVFVVDVVVFVVNVVCSDAVSYFHIQSVIAIMSLVLSSLTCFFVFNSVCCCPFRSSLVNICLSS